MNHELRQQIKLQTSGCSQFLANAQAFQMVLQFFLLFGKTEKASCDLYASSGSSINLSQYNETSQDNDISENLIQQY